MAHLSKFVREELLGTAFQVRSLFLSFVGVHWVQHNFFKGIVLPKFVRE